MAQKANNFEKNLEALDKLVTEMESGELSIEEALKAYEKGVKLVRQCQETLTKAEQKVKILTEKAGVEELEDFWQTWPHSPPLNSLMIINNFSSNSSEPYLKKLMTTPS